MLNKNITTKKEKGEYTVLTMLNTNARSLCPKVKSLIDCVDEMEAGFAVVTETWLADGPTLQDDTQDLELGVGLSIIHKNMKACANGVTYGGVVIIYRKDTCNFKEIKFENRANFEVVVAVGAMQGHARKLAVVGCYIPPNYTGQKSGECLQYIADIVAEIKRTNKDPYIVVSGDVNQWDLTMALEEYPDLVESAAGPTRGTRTNDRTFTNFENVFEVGTVLPLQTEGQGSDLKHSDHKVC